VLTLTKKTKANPEARKRLIVALKALGYQPIGTRSRLFEALELNNGPDYDRPFTYFIGRDGELRMSRTARLSDSISVRGLDVYDRLLEQGRTLLEAA
jgi:hypothetical protein